MSEAYPLSWPSGWPRTKKPTRSRFGQRSDKHYCLQKISMTKARGDLLDELRMLGAHNVVISTNLALRLDGLPRASQRTPDDTGVAVYFTLKSQQKCFPCDKWDRVEDNLYAIAKTINALRGVERWGSKSMVDATFNGFKALPDLNSEISWRDIFNMPQDKYPGFGEITLSILKERYRESVKIHHPDKGGDPAEFDHVQKAYEQALRERK